VVTTTQLTRTNSIRVFRFRKKKHKVLKNSPQRRGVVRRVYTIAPKKPCSARRPVVRVKLTSGYAAFCHIPGEGRHLLHKFSTILVRGGRPADLPAVRHRAVRSWRQGQLRYPIYRKTSRSVYGLRNLYREKRVRLFSQKAVRLRWAEPAFVRLGTMYSRYKKNPLKYKILIKRKKFFFEQKTKWR
jgi:ribosomal protein S12